MSIKSAALFALIGMLFLTIVVAFDFIDVVIGISGGIVPALAFFRALIYLLASLSLLVFFFVFHNRQGNS